MWLSPGKLFSKSLPMKTSPFTIDAGKAKVKVIGTSFNVITSNSDSAVEVFVKTGKVMVTDIDDSNNLILDPGFIGKVYSERRKNR